MKFSVILVVVNGNFFCDLSNGILIFSVLFVMALITVKVLKISTTFLFCPKEIVGYQGQSACQNTENSKQGRP